MHKIILHLHSILKGFFKNSVTKEVEYFHTYCLQFKDYKFTLFLLKNMRTYTVVTCIHTES